MSTLETIIDFDEALADCANIDAADAATVSTMFLTFDIETGPLPTEQLEPLIPSFDPGDPPGEFDETAVKYGNTKDTAKRAEILKTARERHLKSVSEWDQTVAEKRQKHRDKFFADAALSAITGRVLAIGLSGRGVNGVDASDAYSMLTAENEEQEAAILEDFWSTFKAAEVAGNGRLLVGFDIRRFDLPFMVQRSWILGVEVPRSVFDGRYWSTLFVDLVYLWGCGSNHTYISLNTFARALKIGEKTGKGEDFHRLFWTDRHSAIAYLRNDLDLTRRGAVRLGVR